MSHYTARYPSLAGRSVFVTGGGSGIGASIVSMFAAQDAKVAFIDIAEGASRALADAIAAQGRTAPWWRTCDVRDIAALRAAMADAAAAQGDFHVLVNLGPRAMTTVDSATATPAVYIAIRLMKRSLPESGAAGPS